MGECQLAWVREIQKDYAEEFARLAATTFTLGFADLTGLGWLFGQRTAQASRGTQESHRSEVEAGLSGSGLRRRQYAYSALIRRLK